MSLSTPHARGSTAVFPVVPYARCVYPACAGIHRRRGGARILPRRLPRMRGDPPGVTPGFVALLRSTPHARGSTLQCLSAPPVVSVYPACAGIHPHALLPPWSSGSLPRMRGDPPSKIIPIIIVCQSTPHARGSTSRHLEIARSQRVYPACAGIHPGCVYKERGNPRLPRMRGDPPCGRSSHTECWWSTPHARGSTPVKLSGPSFTRVYPACAGIHRQGKEYK